MFAGVCLCVVMLWYGMFTPCDLLCLCDVVVVVSLLWCDVCYWIVVLLCLRLLMCFVEFVSLLRFGVLRFVLLW